MFIYFGSPTGSFFVFAFGQPWFIVSDLIIHPFSLKPSMHCMILTCWDEQPGNIRPDFLFPRTAFSLQVLGEQRPIICSQTTITRSDMSEILLGPQRFSQWNRTLSWSVHLSLSAPVQSNKSPWPCVAGMKIRRQDRWRGGNSLKVFKVPPTAAPAPLLFRTFSSKYLGNLQRSQLSLNYRVANKQIDVRVCPKSLLTAIERREQLSEAEGSFSQGFHPNSVSPLVVLNDRIRVWVHKSWALALHWKQFSHTLCVGITGKIFKNCVFLFLMAAFIQRLKKTPYTHSRDFLTVSGRNPNTIGNYKGPNQNQKMSSSIFCSGCVNHGTLSGSELNLQFHRHENKGNAKSLSIKLSG